MEHRLPITYPLANCHWLEDNGAGMLWLDDSNRIGYIMYDSSEDAATLLPIIERVVTPGSVIIIWWVRTISVYTEYAEDRHKLGSKQESEFHDIHAMSDTDLYVYMYIVCDTPCRFYATNNPHHKPMHPDTKCLVKMALNSMNVYLV